jgi:hypothetical protein
LLFDEWQPEEGHPLPRVWIRIYRLPAKLCEFSVLWALGSMLGATQTVDTVTSLRQYYGRVEVAVLNVDLLPNMIDTVVIGDRLYSLPIQVEGREDNEEVEAQMDLVDGANDNANGSDKPTESKEEKFSEGKRTMIGQKVQATGMNIQVEQSKAVVHQKKEQQILLLVMVLSAIKSILHTQSKLVIHV